MLKRFLIGFISMFAIGAVCIVLAVIEITLLNLMEPYVGVGGAIAIFVTGLGCLIGVIYAIWGK